MKFIQNTRSISILYISCRILIDLLVFCMNFIQNTNRFINILYQNKTGTQKRQTNNWFFFNFRPVLSFYLEFKIKFILQLLKVALEATFATILSTPDARLKLA